MSALASKLNVCNVSVCVCVWQIICKVCPFVCELNSLSCLSVWLLDILFYLCGKLTDYCQTVVKNYYKTEIKTAPDDFLWQVQTMNVHEKCIFFLNVWNESFQSSNARLLETVDICEPYKRENLSN